MTSDFLLQNEGTISLLHPQSESAREWVDEHVSREGFQPFWPTVVIEHRYVCDILTGLQADNLSVEGV